MKDAKPIDGTKAAEILGELGYDVQALSESNGFAILLGIVVGVAKEVDRLSKEVELQPSVPLNLRRYTGEPCRSAGFPEEVLLPSGFKIPMYVALSLDKKQLLLIDSVDYYQFQSLTKSEALSLAAEFKALAEEME
jgi:hypothetical protein